MKEERYHIALDKYDRNIVINALNTLRTRQIQEERPTEPVDELIDKVAKEAMFLEYSELLNAFDSGATTKLTINNRRLNRVDFEQTILIPMAEDGLDKYRKEYNKMLLDKASLISAI